MARPKKIQPGVVSDPDEVFSLKTSELLWMRDKFISGLSNLESGVHELRRAYISHFNTLLPEGHPGRLNLPFFTPFQGDTSQLGAQAAALGAASDGSALAAPTAPGGTQKKKRKPHDPNAPKRALTSYFLFMQHNKPQIKEENPSWDAKTVAEESERRWNNISEDEKKRYEYMYQVDLARYYKQKEVYEAGGDYHAIDPEDCRKLYEEHQASGIPFKGRKGKKAERLTSDASNLAPVVSEQRMDNDEDDDEDEHDPDDDAEGTSDDEEEDSEAEPEEQALPPPKSYKRQKKEEPAAVSKPTPKLTAAAAKKAQAAATAAQIQAQNQLASQLSAPSSNPNMSAQSQKKQTGRKGKQADFAQATEEPMKKSRKRKNQE